MEWIKSYGWLLLIVGPVCGAIGAMVTMAIRTYPRLVEIRAKGDESAMAMMKTRLEAAEKRLADVEAQLQVTRHQLNNERQAFDMLILLLETNPDRVQDNLDRVRQYRANRDQVIAAEKGAIAANKAK